jgi:hypothetical protein
MADEQEAIAPLPELDTPAIEQEQETAAETEVPEDVTEPGDEPTSEDDDGTDEEPVEYVTLERNGKQYQVPKELEGEFLMQSDYTRKTQAAAEQAKALESREAEINQRLEATEEELDARAQVRAIDAELARFENYDWQAYQQHRREDPLGADEAWQYIHHLKDQRTGLDGKLSQAQTERTEKAQQDLAKRVQETLAEAPKIIPGWKPENANAQIDTLVKFAQSEGIPDQVLQANWSPMLLKLLHRAHVGTTAMQKQATAKPTPVPIQPLRTVAGKSTPAAARNLTEIAKGDDMEAYAKARAAGRVR